MITNFMQLVPLLFWQVLWLVGFWVLCWRVYAGELQSCQKKNYIKLIAFLAIMAMPLIYSGYVHNRRWGVVIEPSLAIYVGPGNTYPIKTNLLFLTDVCIDRAYKSIESKQQDWLHIVADHVTGWVPAHAIREY